MAGQVEPSALEPILLFKGLTPDERRHVGAMVKPSLVPPGVRLVSAGTSGDDLCVIVRGAVKVHLATSQREVILAILGRGEVIGEMSMLDSPAHSATATTIDETATLQLDGASFRQLLQEIPMISINLALILSRRIRMADAQIQALAALDLNGRVARQLLAFAIEYGEAAGDGSKTIPFRLKQSDLANMVGSSRGRVNQSINLFKKRGLISFDIATRLVVRDLDALARYCI